MTGFCQDPSGQLFNVFLNQPYPFNQMPAPSASDPSSMSQFSLNLLSLFPQPNCDANVYCSTQTRRDDTDEFGIRVDHYLTPADNLNFRYMFSKGTVFDPLSPAGASVPGFPVGEDHRAQNFVAQETHTFSPSMIGQLRISYLRNKFLVDQHLNHTSPASLGFTIPQVFRTQPARHSSRSMDTQPPGIRLPVRVTPTRMLSIIQDR
jgi:hypothetical protein